MVGRAHNVCHATITIIMLVILGDNMVVLLTIIVLDV